MPAIRGLTVCRTKPGDDADGTHFPYDKLLAITLPRNLRHLTECVVVTAPEDERTKAVCRDLPNVRIFETTAFTEHGARFNKGLAIERAFDFMGRDGWILIWDADTLFPDTLPLDDIAVGHLYGLRRRLLDDPRQWHPGFSWTQARKPIHDHAHIGYFQLFSCDDPRLPHGTDSDGRNLSWYEVTFPHGGGGDGYFPTHWPGPLRKTLKSEVLHLGPRDRHWFGSDAESRDIMNAFRVRNGWTRDGIPDPSANDRVGSIVERINVPGYAPTGYELPFISRARARQRVG